MIGIDRQLKRVDSRQAAFFGVPGEPANIVVFPDPVRAWGEIRPHGKVTLESAGLAPKPSRAGPRAIELPEMGHQALDVIAGRIRASKAANGGSADRVGFYLTSRGITNEVYYVAQKAARFIGSYLQRTAASISRSIRSRIPAD